MSVHLQLALEYLGLRELHLIKTTSRIWSVAAQRTIIKRIREFHLLICVSGYGDYGEQELEFACLSYDEKADVYDFSDIIGEDNWTRIPALVSDWSFISIGFIRRRRVYKKNTSISFENMNNTNKDGIHFLGDLAIEIEYTSTPSIQDDLEEKKEEKKMEEEEEEEDDDEGGRLWWAIDHIYIRPSYILSRIYKRKKIPRAAVNERAKEELRRRLDQKYGISLKSVGFTIPYFGIHANEQVADRIARKWELIRLLPRVFDKGSRYEFLIGEDAWFHLSSPQVENFVSNGVGTGAALIEEMLDRKRELAKALRQANKERDINRNICKDFIFSGKGGIETIDTLLQEICKPPHFATRKRKYR